MYWPDLTKNYVSAKRKGKNVRVYYVDMSMTMTHRKSDEKLGAKWKQKILTYGTKQKMISRKRSTATKNGATTGSKVGTSMNDTGIDSSDSEDEGNEQGVSVQSRRAIRANKQNAQMTTEKRNANSISDGDGNQIVPNEVQVPQTAGDSAGQSEYHSCLCMCK